MGYRAELIAHAQDLLKQAREVDIAAGGDAGLDKVQRLERLAEIIDFVVRFPDDAFAELKREEAAGEDAV